MPAAYYDISIEEGSSYRLKLKFKDALGQVVDLKETVLAPEGFEDQLGTNIGVFAKMQVRNSVNASIVELNSISVTDSGAVALFGESWKPAGSTAIQLDLGVGYTQQGTLKTPAPNIKLSLSSFNSRRINYGNYLYDLELVYYKKPSTGEPNYTAISEGLDKDTVVFRILQGRFTVTPAISR